MSPPTCWGINRSPAAGFHTIHCVVSVCIFPTFRPTSPHVLIERNPYSKSFKQLGHLKTVVPKFPTSPSLPSGVPNVSIFTQAPTNCCCIIWWKIETPETCEFRPLKTAFPRIPPFFKWKVSWTPNIFFFRGRAVRFRGVQKGQSRRLRQSPEGP